MSKSKVWKDFERELAKWFGSVRNIGSGKINSCDSGEPRPGDVVLPIEYSALIEAKTRITFPKSGIYFRALQTCEDAKAENRQHFFHFERKNGSKKIYILATNAFWMEKICGFIKEELEKEYVNDRKL